MKISKSPWVLHYDGSSCNGCDIEVLAATTPRYDLERFGIINTGDPKHADVFLITGGINFQNRMVVQQLYSQMPDPKVVVAVGICACDGGVFKECYNIMGGVDKVIPVDVYVPGCAARPESIIDGVVKALAILDQKRERMKKGFPAEEREWTPAGQAGKGTEAMANQEARIEAQIRASDAARAAMRKEQEEELHGGHE